MSIYNWKHIVPFTSLCPDTKVIGDPPARGVTALTRVVSGEKQIYSGKPGKFFGKYEIFSGH